MKTSPIDVLDDADGYILQLFQQIEIMRDLLLSGEEGTFAMHDALKLIEQRTDEIYSCIGLARETTRHTLETADYLMEQRREAVAAYRAIAARLKAMGNK